MACLAVTISAARAACLPLYGARTLNAGARPAHVDVRARHRLRHAGLRIFRRDSLTVINTLKGNKQGRAHRCTHQRSMPTDCLTCQRNLNKETPSPGPADANTLVVIILQSSRTPRPFILVVLHDVDVDVWKYTDGDTLLPAEALPR